MVQIRRKDSGRKLLHHALCNKRADLFQRSFQKITGAARTGNRVRYEDKLFSKRQALGALVLAECVENKGRFTDDIVNGIYAICDEKFSCFFFLVYKRDNAK